MSDTGSSKAEWIKRVLGLDLAPPNPVTPKEPVDLNAIWRDAKEATDQQLNVLAGKLRATGDPDLVRIADLGLFSIGGGRGINVALRKALLEYGAASTDRRPAAAQQVRKAVTDYRAAITGNPGIALIDRNPFGVTVGLGPRLGAALDRIEQSLA
ncbi:MAG TPA: hypothetical protein VND19_08425 [Acetobacteraceae bacterium]|nr:hypothetical protein [Acetobacteraceae bacterium]